MKHLFDRKDRYCLIVDISPEIAETWITECNSHNRKLVESHAQRLAGEMKADRWRLTHQGIAFDTNGVLIDGQHRLWAIVLSGKTIPMRVFFNEPADSLGAVDVIRARSNDEVITLAGDYCCASRDGYDQLLLWRDQSWVLLGSPPEPCCGRATRVVAENS